MKLRAKDVLSFNQIFLVCSRGTFQWGARQVWMAQPDSDWITWCECTGTNNDGQSQTNKREWLGCGRQRLSIRRGCLWRSSGSQSRLGIVGKTKEYWADFFSTKEGQSKKLFYNNLNKYNFGSEWYFNSLLFQIIEGSGIFGTLTL